MYLLVYVSLGDGQAENKVKILSVREKGKGKDGAEGVLLKFPHPFPQQYS